MKLLLTLLLFINLFPVSAYANETVDLNDFSTLPILHEGRVRPLDSFARIILIKFSGEERLKDQTASRWLANTLFDPASAVEKPIFKIFDTDQFNLKKQKNNLYSYIDLSRAINIQKNVIGQLINTPPDQWSEQQKTLMELHENYILMTQILRSLTLILPIKIGENSKEKNYLYYQKNRADIDKKVKEIIRKKGTNFDQYNEEEKIISITSYQLNTLETASITNNFLRVIPANWNREDSVWETPWSAIKKEGNSLKTKSYIKNWESMAAAFRINDKQKFNNSVSEAIKLFNDSSLPTKNLKIEKIYNDLNLVYWAKIFFIISLTILILFSFYPKRALEKISFWFLSIGLIDLVLHIFLRSYILERPPVGTLYESILFVCAICVAGFIFMAIKQKHSSPILLGSLSGAILLLTAQGFSSGDTMGTLVAVLNTNFWLSTHVLCISIGYGLCLITSLIGHYYLMLCAFKRSTEPEILNKTISNIKTLAILSLLFTTIGTILGGIWADQSWGRFWGWDPKENGALLIVLWLAWMLHGRISGHINDIWYGITASFLSVIVVLAWFGVNLLNIGLHSYGFISGVAMGISIFCLFETILLLGLSLWIKKQERSA